jgi:hypothetical protein
VKSSSSEDSQLASAGKAYTTCPRAFAAESLTDHTLSSKHLCKATVTPGMCVLKGSGFPGTTFVMTSEMQLHAASLLVLS